MTSTGPIAHNTEFPRGIWGEVQWVRSLPQSSREQVAALDHQRQGYCSYHSGCYRQSSVHDALPVMGCTGKVAFMVE